MQREGQYRGVTYRVDAQPAPGDTYIGHYQLLDAGRRRSDTTDHAFLGGGSAANDAFGAQLEPPGDEQAPQAGIEDVVHPPVGHAWATENEALTYATEAACHAIEIMQLGRPQAQGRGSGSSWRRTDSLGQ